MLIRSFYVVISLFAKFYFLKIRCIEFPLLSYTLLHRYTVRSLSRYTLTGRIYPAHIIVTLRSYKLSRPCIIHRKRVCMTKMAKSFQWNAIFKISDFHRDCLPATNKKPKLFPSSRNVNLLS